MNFTLDIPNKTAIWHPGQTIQGIARLKPCREGETAEVKAVRVELIGEMRTETAFYYGFIDSANMETHVPLFREGIELFHGPYKVGTAQEWPFVLHIPTDCRFAKPRSLGIPEAEQTRFDLSLMQTLPPSMHVETESKDGHKSCVIRYRVTGRVQTTQYALAREKEVMLDLRIIPPRAEAERNRQPKFTLQNVNVSVESIHLDPAIGNRDLTFKEKLKVAMGRTLPSVKFKMQVQFPDAGVMFDPPSIHLRLATSEFAGGAGVPEVLLKHFSLCLLRNIAQVTHRMDGPHIHHWRHPDRITIAKWQGSVHVSDTLDLKNLYVFEECKWDRISPTFRTFACGQTWTLQLTTTIEVARVEQVMMAQQAPFTVLSPFVDEHEGGSMDDFAPPSYGGNAPAYSV